MLAPTIHHRIHRLSRPEATSQKPLSSSATICLNRALKIRGRRRLAKVISLSILALIIDRSASATAIAILRTPSEIVVAADSRSVNEEGLPSGSSCKIQEVEGTLFVVNGLEKDKSGRDVPSVAKEALKAGGPLRNQVAKFDELINVPLQSAINRIVQTDSPAKTFILENAVLGVNFAGIENNIPYLYGRRFTISRDNPVVRAERHECPGSECPNGQITVLVASPSASQKFRKDHTDLSGNLAEMARRFVQEQIDEDIPDVGPPIDLARLTDHGLEWIQQKPGC